MSDPQWIERMLSQLREIWTAFPDWRLGQLIVNAAGLTEPCPLYSIADDEMEKMLALSNNNGWTAPVIKLSCAHHLLM